MLVNIRVDSTAFRDRLGRFAKVPEESIAGAGQAIYDYLVEYHSRIDWKEGHWFPGPGSGDFAKSVVQGWQPPVLSGRTIEIRNTFGLLGWKVSGGDISPRRASHLTIPLISAARHMSVAEFSSGGTKLFKAGNALCRKIGKKIEAVYALSSGVKQSPYPNAMPSQKDMKEVVQRTALEVFKAIS